MYLAETATNMYTQTLPDYMYASQISAYKYMLWGGGGDRCDILSVSDFSVPKPLHIHIFYDHDDKNIPPIYPIRLLIKDILFINIQPSTENQALLPVSCKLYNFKLAYNKLAILQFLSFGSMKQTSYLKALIIR